jgi:hypothetical protein
LRAELGSAPERTSLDDDSYLLALTARARVPGERLGVRLDEASLKRLERIAVQRTARSALAPDLTTAIKLAPGALAHPPDSLLGRNGDHLAAFVARAQRPDGTFSGGDGWALQRSLVATAEGLAALKPAAAAGAIQKEPGERERRYAAAAVRARGAFERLGAHIDDPYTAAVVLAAGALEGALADELRGRVLSAIVELDGGGDGRALPVPPGVVRADGSVPTTIEATALAVLALRDHPAASAVLPDLGASILSAYRPGVGFGDGATNRAALEAVAHLFATPLPSRVVVSLGVDGKARGADTLEGDRLHEVMTLDVGLEAVGRSLAVTVEADPPLPGLSFVLEVDYAVPWSAPSPDAGLNLVVDVPKGLAVGAPAEVALRAVAPGGAALRVVHGLPAGVDAVPASLEALVAAGVIERFEAKGGVVVLHAPPRRQGELFQAKYKVIPALAGTLRTRVASVELQGRPSTIVHFPPAAWTIAR